MMSLINGRVDGQLCIWLVSPWIFCFVLDSVLSVLDSFVRN